MSKFRNLDLTKINWSKYSKSDFDDIDFSVEKELEALAAFQAYTVSKVDNNKTKYCCKYKCFPEPEDHVDGIACLICKSFGYCRCACISFVPCELDMSDNFEVDDGYCCKRMCFKVKEYKKGRRPCRKCRNPKFCICECRDFIRKGTKNATFCCENNYCFELHEIKFYRRGDCVCKNPLRFCRCPCKSYVYEDQSTADGYCCPKKCRPKPGISMDCYSWKEREDNVYWCETCYRQMYDCLCRRQYRREGYCCHRKCFKKSDKKIICERCRGPNDTCMCACDTYFHNLQNRGQIYWCCEDQCVYYWFDEIVRGNEPICEECKCFGFCKCECRTTQYTYDPY